MKWIRVLSVIWACLTASAQAQIAVPESQLDAGSRALEGQSYRLSSTLGQTVVGQAQGVLQLQTRTPLMTPLLPRAVVGDVNGDGQRTFEDALMVLQFVLGFEMPSVAQQTAADVDGDGQLTTGDVILILRMDAGLETASKPAVIAGKPSIIVPRVMEDANTVDDVRAVRLILNAGAAAGDLVLTHEVKGDVAVDVVGLSPEGMVSIKTEREGMIRIGFAQPESMVEDLILNVTLPGVERAESVQIRLDGNLYGVWGNSVGQVQMDWTVEPVRPRDFALFQNAPNPFNPETTIRYELPEAGFVALTLYDVKGQQIQQLVSAHMDAGRYDVRWDGRDAYGRAVASGIYFYRVDVAGGKFSAVRRMVLLK